MHILFLSHYFPPEVNAPATRTFEHCRKWVAAGHRVTVVTCAPNCPHGEVFEGYRNAWRSEETLSGIRVVRVWTYLAANKGFARRIANYLSYMLRATLFAVSSVRDADVVVATSPQFFCGWAGLLTARILRRRFVLEIRDLWPDSIVAVDAMKKSWLIALLERLERRMYAAASHIVTVGSGYRDGLIAKGVEPHKISVVPNGVDVSGFRVVTGDAHDLRREMDAEGKFVCAYIGTVGMAHGLEVVIEAARLAKQHSMDHLAFWIVGDGARRAELERQANEHQLDNVRFTGMLPKQRMPEVIASCDACLVHLRGTELFGTVLPSKLFEIMAMNVPIIMGVRGQAQQIVLEAGAGVAMTPDCAQSLLRGIQEIEHRGRAVFSQREYVVRHFDRERLAAEMLEVVTWRPAVAASLRRAA